MAALEIILYYILVWGFIASIIFTLLLLLLYVLDAGNLIRDTEGKFKNKEKIPSVGYLLFIVVIILLIGFPVLVNVFFVLQEGIKPNLFEIFMLSYGIFFFVNLWDLILIDYFLVVKNVLRLKNLPQTPYYTTFRPHLIGFFKGLMYGIVFSSVSTIISFLIIGQF